MKTTIAAAVLLCAALCAGAQTNWNLTFTPSPDDNGSNGLYTFTALPTNAASINAQVAFTNAPAGSTNICFSPSSLPGNPCFVFGSFATATATSALSCPSYFDTNAWNVAPVPPRPIPKPPVIIRR